MEGLPLHFINASLPLRDENKLYEVKAAGGRWAAVREQETRLPAEAGTLPLTQIETNRLMGEPLRSVDLEGRLLLPGLVDAHMHLDKAFSLSTVSNVSGTLLEAIRNYGAAAPGFSKAEIIRRIRKGALLALSFGTTSIRSHLDFNIKAGKEVAFRTIEAALEAREQLRGLVDIQFFPMCPYDVASTGLRDALEEALRLGMDGIGGAPHLSETPEEDIDWIFRMAERTGKPVDLHSDESDDPAKRTVLAIAEKTLQYGYQGRVAVDHLCSLSAMEENDAERVIRTMADAELNAVTLPAVNMYLQGRDDRGLVRRGTTRIRELLAAGIPLAAASDNIQDPFHPFGRGDLTQIASITAYAAHMGGKADLRRLLRMITETPAAILGLSQYGIREGGTCDFVIIDARSVDEWFTDLPAGRWVYKYGKWQSVTVQSKCWTSQAAANWAGEKL